MKEFIMRPDHRHHYQTLSSSSSRLELSRNSHVRTKVKPKIRIIHIFAPEIIKTDVENFRGLVQRLTGKPDDKIQAGKKTAKKPPVDPNSIARLTAGQGPSGEACSRLGSFSALLMNGGGGESVKEEGGGGGFERWGGESSNPFFDLESLTRDFGDEYSSLPMKSSNSAGFFHC